MQSGRSAQTKPTFVSRSAARRVRNGSTVDEKMRKVSLNDKVLGRIISTADGACGGAT